MYRHKQTHTKTIMLAKVWTHKTIRAWVMTRETRPSILTNRFQHQNIFWLRFVVFFLLHESPECCLEHLTQTNLPLKCKRALGGISTFRSGHEASQASPFTGLLRTWLNICQRLVVTAHRKQRGRRDHNPAAEDTRGCFLGCAPQLEAAAVYCAVC